MREEDYADIPDEVMAEYFAAKDRRSGMGTCRTCAHNGCCDTSCGGRYWKEETSEPENDYEGQEEEEE